MVSRGRRRLHRRRALDGERQFCKGRRQCMPHGGRDSRLAVRPGVDLDRHAYSEPRLADSLGGTGGGRLVRDGVLQDGCHASDRLAALHQVTEAR